MIALSGRFTVQTYRDNSKGFQRTISALKEAGGRHIYTEYHGVNLIAGLMTIQT